jgi:LPXTG-motif cell wall-anchored protein
VSTDGGVTWTKATEENFPEGGLTVILAYPEGTNGSGFDFSVSHMFTITSTRLGTTAGDIEYPSAEKTAEGLKVTLTGLSPVAVSWVKKDPGETPAPTDTPAPTATVQPVPKTGDSSTPALWLGLALLGMLGIAGFCAAMARTAGKRR